MFIHIIRCGDASLPRDLPLPVHDTPSRPGRRELRVIDDLAAHYLPYDPTPRLDEIAAQPDVAHLGAPAADPRRPVETVRLVVVGTDADLDAVATRLMRIDATWIELAYIPTQREHSPIATSWGIEDKPWSIALSGAVNPVPLIRDDSGLATLGVAEICMIDGSPFVGEIIIDDATIAAPRGAVFFGARIAAAVTAPGVAAVAMTGPSVVLEGDASAVSLSHAGKKGEDTKNRPGFVGRLFHRGPVAGACDGTVHSGRAVQAGGDSFIVYRDGVPHPRQLTRVTFYRHLRDLQAVRP